MPSRYLLLVIFFVIILLHACKIQPSTVNDIYNKQAHLPQDEAPHYKNSLEWWYFTGHLKAENKKEEYGVEFVFFNFNPFNKNDYIMANMAISDTANDQFYHDYQVIKLDQPLKDTLPLNLSINKDAKWTLSGKEGHYRLKGSMAKHPGYGMDLRTTPDKPLLMHGKNGYENYGNYASAGYYSYPRLNTTGTIQMDGKTMNVSGELWYDRQWNCISVWQENISWEWIAIQFQDSKSELMLYKIHHYEKKDSIAGGTLFNEHGEVVNLESNQIHIKPKELWKSPDSGKVYPVAWEIDIPDHGYNLHVQASFPNQEVKIRFNILQKMYYWEGKCIVSGTKGSKPISGNSYVEITNKK